MRYLTVIFCLSALFADHIYGKGLSQYERDLVQSIGHLFGEEKTGSEMAEGVFQAEGTWEEVERAICATPIFLKIRHNWNGFSAKTRAILGSYTERPTLEHTYDTPQGNFKIYYDTEGDNAVSSEGWVIDTVAPVLENVWSTQINILGYNQPPSDGWYHDTLDNGGDGKYDVYLVDLSYVYLGYTQVEYFLSPQSHSATSYIVLDNDYVGYGSLHTRIEWLEVTFAHQFFHAIQLGYDATEYEDSGDPPMPKPYWMEISAVWMEDMVYDNINDYLNYLPHFFDSPWLSLRTFRSYFDPHPYASCVWAFFLSERYGTEIIRDIWEECAQVPGDNVLDATDQVLQQPPYSTSFEDAFREFTVWNFFTSLRADTVNFYSEGSLFDTNSMIKPVVNQYHTSYPALAPDPLPNPPQQLGSNYVFFVSDGSNRNLKIDFYGDSTVSWKVSVIGYESGNPPFIDEFILDSLQNASMIIWNWNSHSDIVMVPAVTANENGEFGYDYVAFPFFSGDANGDEEINVADVVYLANYLFVCGPAPDPLDAGDANCDGAVNVADITYLVNYLFAGSPPPCEP